jgi:hypothetical protein
MTATLDLAYPIAPLRQPTLARAAEAIVEGTVVRLARPLKRAELSFGDQEAAERFVQRLMDGDESLTRSRSMAALLESLCADGFLRDASVPETALSGLELAGQVRVQIDQALAYDDVDAGLMGRIISGAAPAHKVTGWLLETQCYTRAASRHIAPILDHPHTPQTRAFWQTFVDDESTHWQMYQRAFMHYGVDFDSISSVKPLPTTATWINGLEALARRGVAHYAAAMIFVETPPDAPSMDRDPLSVALMRHYGLPRKAVVPLWGHAVYNGKSRHCDIGRHVLGHHEWFSQAEAATIRDSVRHILDAMRTMCQGIIDHYATPQALAARYPTVSGWT